MTGEIPACPVGMADPRGLLAAAVAVARETIPLSRIDVSVGESRFRRFTSDRVVFEERQGEWFCSGRQIKFMDRSTLGVVAEAIGYAAAERISATYVPPTASEPVKEPALTPSRTPTHAAPRAAR